MISVGGGLDLEDPNSLFLSEIHLLIGDFTNQLWNEHFEMRSRPLRRLAKFLCRASDVKLGFLINMNY